LTEPGAVGVTGTVVVGGVVVVGGGVVVVGGGVEASTFEKSIRFGDLAPAEIT
jgi:hypothetical protein